MKKIVARIAQLVVAGILIAMMPAVSAQAAVGIGGGASFQYGAVFPFIAGQETSIESSFFVQNLGTRVAKLAFEKTKTPGIAARALHSSDLTLSGRASRTLPFRLTVAKFVAPGDYPVIISLKQTNPPQAKPGETVYAPAISGSAVVRVSRASATVIVSSVNADDMSPIVGDLRLWYTPADGKPLELAYERASSLKRKVIEGNYEVAFEIPGLVKQVKRFSIAKNETKRVKVKVKGVRFMLASAKQGLKDGDQLIAATLSVAVRNQIARLNGPIRFAVRVSRDGKFIDQVTFSKLAELPTGNTEQQTVYSPPGGFSPGVWKFHFIVKGPNFKVESEKDPTISLSPQISLWWLLILFLLVAVFVWVAYKRSTRPEGTSWIEALNDSLVEPVREALSRLRR